MCVVSHRMLLEKSSEERLVFTVTVSEKTVTIRYSQANSQTPLMVRFRTEGRLVLERWTHLVLQVRNLNSLELCKCVWCVCLCICLCVFIGVFSSDTPGDLY